MGKGGRGEVGRRGRRGEKEEKREGGREEESTLEEGDRALAGSRTDMISTVFFL